MGAASGGGCDGRGCGRGGLGIDRLVDTMTRYRKYRTDGYDEADYQALRAAQAEAIEAI